MLAVVLVMGRPPRRRHPQRPLLHDIPILLHRLPLPRPFPRSHFSSVDLNFNYVAINVDYDSIQAFNFNNMHHLIVSPFLFNKTHKDKSLLSSNVS